MEYEMRLVAANTRQGRVADDSTRVARCATIVYIESLL